MTSIAVNAQCEDPPPPPFPHSALAACVVNVLVYRQTAEMPEDWQEDAEEFIPDPSSFRPEDWDDEEDGEWEPIMVRGLCLCAAWNAGRNAFVLCAAFMLLLLLLFFFCWERSRLRFVTTLPRVVMSSIAMLCLGLCFCLFFAPRGKRGLHVLLAHFSCFLFALTLCCALDSRVL